MVEVPGDDAAMAGCVEMWDSDWVAPQVPFGDWDVDDVLAGRVPAATVLADCAAGVPGAGRVLILDQLDPAALDAEAQLDYVRALEEQLRWLQGRRVRALAAVAAADTSPERWSVIDVARLLQLSDTHASSQLADAADLTERLPFTVRALTEGRIGLRAAEAILDTSKTLTPELHNDLERAVLPRAEQQTVPGLRRSLRRAAIRLDADAAETRRRLAHADRHIRRHSLPDGMSQLTAVLPAADVDALWRRLDAATTLLPPTDTRTVDQQRADLLVDGVLSGIPFDALPELQGRRPTVGVVIELTTLLGLNDNPGELTGHGAITAQTAREIAADAGAQWHRFITDPVTGHLLDYGTTTYRPPQQLRDFILNRWPTCIHPGCHRPAYRSDLDHHRPADTGGPTSSANMYPLCRRHHRAKTTHRWNYTRDHNGNIHWTSENGRKYTDPDPPRWQMPHETPVPRGISRDPQPPDHRDADTGIHADTDRAKSAHQKAANANEPVIDKDMETVSEAGEQGRAAPGDYPDPSAGPLLRLADYLDALPPGVPPF